MNPSINEIIASLEHMQDNEIVTLAGQLTPEQLAGVIFTVNENATFPKNKITQLLLSLHDAKLLEIAGQNLTVPQVLDFLRASDLNKQEGFDRLSPLLVGIDDSKFAELLKNISDDTLRIILKIAFSEPLQHRLTQFVHFAELKFAELSNQSEHLKIDANTIQRNEFIESTKQLTMQFNDLLERSKIASKMSWNTNRIDLIERLNQIIIHISRTLKSLIGHPENKSPATGLYALISEKIDQNNSQDDEPAIEGLSKFSVWYLSDYWEAGLLPHIHEASELEGNQKHQEQLFTEVIANLEKFKLKTTGDLKNAGINSKKSLKEYIQNHQNDV